MTWSRTGPMERSVGVKPGTSALVESTRKRSTPSSPRRENARRSVMRPSRGSWSILKSPVARAMPAGVRIATASASGMEWFTATNSRSNGPTFSCWPSFTVRVKALMRCSFSFASTRASVSPEPISGMSLFSRSRYGTAPMWSSCPCVRTPPTMSSRGSRIGSKSGRMRSTPGWCSSGKSTPQSTMRILPAYSNTVMLRPISPRPPIGMTRSVPSSRADGSARGMDMLSPQSDTPRVRSFMVTRLSASCRAPSAGRRPRPRCGRAGSSRSPPPARR